MPPPRLPLRPRFPLPITHPLRHHRRHLIAPPTSSSGPLLTRRSDRALPPLPRPGILWLKTLPVFLAIITASALCIFNYQKASSSVVSATLYALRTSAAGRRELGDEIYFRDRFPWIWGELNQLQGRIDVRFGVKGTKGKGVMRFRSVRRGRGGFFETKEWSLELEDGRVLQLLDEERADPFKNTALQAAAGDGGAGSSS
ncbi:MAG: hypothetical protein LQ345_002105 [Seirophora villosa]|nr:MAG: hypothetical protein LQ345_002105 [Seirophora villosa]